MQKHVARQQTATQVAEGGTVRGRGSQTAGKAGDTRVKGKAGGGDPGTPIQ